VIARRGREPSKSMMACTMYVAADNVIPSLNPKLNTHWPVKAIRNTTNKF
jgi:hypothetical protein